MMWMLEGSSIAVQCSRLWQIFCLDCCMLECTRTQLQGWYALLILYSAYEALIRDRIVYSMNGQVEWWKRKQR